MLPSSTLRALEDHASAYATRAYVPFSGEPDAVVLLLSNGDWIPGVRIESASFSLTIPSVLNAYTTAVALGRAEDIVAVIASRALRTEEAVYLRALPGPRLTAVDDHVQVRSEGDAVQEAGPLADDALPPYLHATVDSPASGIALARRVAERAYTPASQFPVGAVLRMADGSLVPGVNVEHEDWARILCAERNALGTAWSYGHTDVETLYLTCPLDAEGTPCGACRQLLAELAPTATLWMDRHDAPPASAQPGTLLPGSFSGRALLRHSGS